MKNWKQCTFFGFLTVIMLVFVFIACDNSNGNNNDPKCSCPNGTNHQDAPCGCGAYDCTCTNNPMGNPQLHEAQISFDVSYLNGDDTPFIATVKGMLLASEWEGLASRIETVIQKNIDSMTTGGQANRFIAVFGEGKAVIFVDKDADKDWFVSNKHLVTFDLDYLNGQSDEELAISFFEIVTEMRNAPEVAKLVYDYQ